MSPAWLRAPLTLLGASLLAFWLLAVAGPDPVAARLGPHASAAQVAALRQSLGLDQGFWPRYAAHLQGWARGDGGRSWADGRAVAPPLAQAASLTLGLVLPGFALGQTLALGLAALALRRPGGGLDRSLSAAAALGLSLGLVSLVLLVQSGLCSPAGLDACPLRGSGEALLRERAAPTLALMLAVACGHFAAWRSLLAQALAQPLQQGLRARGLGYGRRLWRHLRPALGPALRARLAYSLPPWLLGASLVLEQAFALPGLGLHLQQALHRGDVPVLLALVELGAAVYLLAGALAATPRPVAP